MARLYISHFTGGATGQFTINGQLIDKEKSIDQGFSCNTVYIDTSSSVSGRQQILDGLVGLVNEQLVAEGVPLTLIASDIEFIC